ncbi:alpha/beta-hydrolase [Exidia glandulosa HHB12029]|uniref:Alpha/beta-hydrolase n=1 Tax=Exidia glandulosa HHB12029 TaxID=1314781 RepID=A0A165CK91_EXIGL|nr:alpha/beta-hydrolase [Exidia glandulosa HHB12029]
MKYASMTTAWSTCSGHGNDAHARPGPTRIGPSTETQDARYQTRVRVPPRHVVVALRVHVVPRAGFRVSRPLGGVDLSTRHLYRCGRRGGGPRVNVGRTVYEGRVEDDGAVEFFGGMRYAQPPIGVRRFAAPEAYVEPAEHESERVMDAARLGKRCMQTPSSLRPVSDMSEDCLTVNVFRPAGLDTSKPVPVMIWIYGGGFQSGTASVYNATSIVRRSVALCTPRTPGSHTSLSVVSWCTGKCVRGAKRAVSHRFSVFVMVFSASTTCDRRTVVRDSAAGFPSAEVSVFGPRPLQEPVNQVIPVPRSLHFYSMGQHPRN